MLAQLAFFISTTIKENFNFMGNKNVEKHSDFVFIDYLLIVAVQAWRDQNQDWNQPIVVVLHQ